MNISVQVWNVSSRLVVKLAKFGDTYGSGKLPDGPGNASSPGPFGEANMDSKYRPLGGPSQSSEGGRYGDLRVELTSLLEHENEDIDYTGMPEHARMPSHSSLDKDLDIEHRDDVTTSEERQRISLMTPMERQKAMQKALAIDPGVGRWSWAAIC
ncbi:hypothetical protein BDN70DRAFT_891685 [Pholiota conissans]|uniref:Uncharacterized protein n=1 Tax=Pholiota conissans TaxID=109636 RepID=A0A9P5ZCI5_9AGAR|nr:hypothetical protein BDN70DRAFT_891685 [Pholiota conissans]